MDLDATEARVLGCLIEKQRTTPDTYPLSLNSLRLACNQTTNRDPVVNLSEPAIRTALAGLARRRWARTTSAAGSRTAKYRHLLDGELGLNDAEVSVLCVLMLRGPQTPGELKQRTERLNRFDGLDEVQSTLDGLIARDLVARLLRRPGQKEERYQELLSAGAGEVASAAAEASAEIDDESGTELTANLGESGDERIARIERELAELRAELAWLRQSLGG